MKKLIGIWCTLLFFIACTSENDPELIPIKSALEKGMIKLTNGIGEWNTGIIYAEDSYLLCTEEMNAQYLQFLTPNEEYDCCIYANKETYLPEQLSFENETFYFMNSGDTLLFVMHTNETGVEPLDSISIQLERNSNSTQSKAAFTTISFLDRDDKVQKVVKALNKILNAGSNFTSLQIKKLKKALDDISIFYYYENVESIIDELDLCREEYEDSDSIIWCFSQYATKKKVHTFESARFGISLWNGSAMNIHAGSAIVCGNIFCPSQEFREKGKCGIIYSTDPDNLTLENNMGIAYPHLWIGRTFYVQLTGLEANTTYYYKAFYDFTTPDHGNLCFKYGNKDADNYVVSDFHMREFTTKEANVKITSLYSNGNFWYEIGHDDNGNPNILGGLHPTLTISTDGVYSVYGWEVIFRYSMENIFDDWWNYKRMSTNGELIPIQELLSPNDNYFIYSKWIYDKFISGKNAVKIILYLSPTQTIESDWYEFGYSYNKGIYSLN